MINYLKIRDGLFFVNQTIEKEQKKVKVVEQNVHHTFIIDCSGSMYYELPAIRKDLYNKISTLLKPADSVTIIWFSGRGEYGVLLEDYTLKSPISLNKVRELIDRWLTPVCLTSFREPLEEIKKVISRVNSKPDVLHTMFFLTDGYDNQSSESIILDAVKDVKDDLNASTIVEYGWYCNRKLLNKMATELGGVHVFSEAFQEYEPYITKEFDKEASSKKEYMSLGEYAPFGGIAFFIDDGDVISVAPNEDNEIAISISDEKNIFYLTEIEPREGKLSNDTDDYISEEFESNGYHTNPIFKGLYAALFSFSRKSDYNIVSEVLKVLGDARFIREKANTFGTQKINELEGKFLEAINNNGLKYTEGYNPDLEPAEDAFCVIDMIEELMSEEGNVWYPRHDAFSYKRTTRKQVSKAKETSDEDKKTLTELIQKNDIDLLKDKIREIEETNPDDLKFVYRDENPPCSFMDLVWNETRANLSVRMNYKGHVVLPDNKFDKLPTKFETNIWRNYTIIKDGIVHTYSLPVSLTENTFSVLQQNGLLKGEAFVEDTIYILDFSDIPVINRKMVKSLSAETLFSNQYEMMQLQSKNSVFNHFKKTKTKNLSKGFIDLYGEEATAWLVTLGLKDYGFNPPKISSKDYEEIQVNSLKVKVKKFGLIKSSKDIQKVIDKMDTDEIITPRERLLVPAIKEFKDFEKLNEGIDDDSIFENWIQQKSKYFRREKARLMTNISKAKFLTIVGKIWFTEFKDRTETELLLERDGEELQFTVEDKMETVKV